MTPIEIVSQFNTAINACDLEALSRLMTEDHVFVDPAGKRVEGRTRCKELWQSFFSEFPDYRNNVETSDDRDGLVVITGRSECSNAELAKPAVWTAQVRGSQVSEWCAYDDTKETRSQLAID